MRVMLVFLCSIVCGVSVVLKDKKKKVYGWDMIFHCQTYQQLHYGTPAVCISFQNGSISTRCNCVVPSGQRLEVTTDHATQGFIMVQFHRANHNTKSPSSSSRWAEPWFDDLMYNPQPVVLSRPSPHQRRRCYFSDAAATSTWKAAEVGRVCQWRGRKLRQG